MIQNKETHRRISGLSLKKAKVLVTFLPGIYLMAIPAPGDSELTPGQREAWDKILFGGLGILLVMVLFFLFLYLRTRKRKNKKPSGY
jgi:hypothetical protein